MAKYLLSGILFLLVFALPASAAPPHERYLAAVDVLTQSDAAADLAYDLSGDPTPAQQVVLYVRFALVAAKDAANGSGGTARKNALAAGEAAFWAYQVAAVLALTDNPAAADYWEVVAQTAYEAVLLLNKNAAR